MRAPDTPLARHSGAAPDAARRGSGGPAEPRHHGVRSQWHTVHGVGPMYLAKFFHRPPGNDDRELLLILDSSAGDGHVLMGFIMDGRSEPYLRHDFTAAG